MIEAVLRGFDKGLFRDNVEPDSEYYYPEKRATIEMYFQILRIAHILSLRFQRFDSSIAEVVPGKH